jgi:hypothetical protein
MADPLTENGISRSGTNAAKPSASASTGAIYQNTTYGYLESYQDGAGTSTPTAGFNPVGGIVARQVVFSENGAGTYTGAIVVPAGAVVLDVIVHAAALWTAGTSASLVVGDGDDADGIYVATNLKATDLLAGESLSFAQSGGRAGAYNAGTNTHWTNRYSASEKTITATVTSVGAGTGGRTRVVVVYALPVTHTATKA